MIRKKTLNLDKQILYRLRHTPVTPKSLAYELGINVWRVYHARRRDNQFAKKKACKIKSMV